MSLGFRVVSGVSALVAGAGSLQAAEASSLTTGAGAIDGLFGAMVVALLLLLLVSPTAVESEEAQAAESERKFGAKRKH